MELYEEDLSLFSGDVLSSFPLFEDIEVYDDLKTDLNVVDTEMFVPSKEEIETLVSNLQSLEPNKDFAPWMENKANLLDLLMNDEVLPDDDNFPASSFDVPMELSQPIADSVENIMGYPQQSLEYVSFDGNLQPNLESVTFTGTNSRPSMENMFSSDPQQVCAPTVTMDVSISPSNDSGVDLSINESDQSLLELLPRQLIENIDDPSSLSLLLGDVVTNVVEPAVSLFPTIMEKRETSGIINVSTTFSPPMSLGESEDESSIPSSNVSIDLCYAPTDGSCMSSDVGSPPPTVDLDQYLSLPSSPSYSVSSMSSGRNSPYAREDPNPVVKISPRSLKSTSGGDRIQDKKLRKMRQNKVAATRYRVKKKLEGDLVGNECQMLQTRNDELRDQVETMTREIAYLKELMADVYQAKLSVKASKHT